MRVDILVAAFASIALVAAVPTGKNDGLPQVRECPDVLDKNCMAARGDEVDALCKALYTDTDFEHRAQNVQRCIEAYRVPVGLPQVRECPVVSEECVQGKGDDAAVLCKILHPGTSEADTKAVEDCILEYEI